jgi:hypothetical protein
MGDPERTRRWTRKDQERPGKTRKDQVFHPGYHSLLGKKNLILLMHTFRGVTPKQAWKLMLLYVAISYAHGEMRKTQGKLRNATFSKKWSPPLYGGGG